MKTRPSYYNIEDFPELHEICENWQIIRKEFKRLDVPIMNVNRQGKNYDEVIKSVIEELAQGKQYGWIEGWGKDGGNTEWIQYGIMSFSEPANKLVAPYIQNVLPETYKMICKIKGINMCALNTLRKHSVIHNHTHPYINEKGLLQLHLPIDTAVDRNYSYLNVEGEFREHQCGKPIVFDGSLDHFAINESDVARTILYLEFKTDSRGRITNV